MNVSLNYDNRVSYCLFCGKYVQKFTRHLLTHRALYDDDDMTVLNDDKVPNFPISSHVFSLILSSLSAHSIIMSFLLSRAFPGRVVFLSLPPSVCFKYFLPLSRLFNHDSLDR